MENSLEELVEIYQESEDDQIFNEIYQLCYPKTLKFLLSKRIPFDDAEDLLSLYYQKDFNTALRRYKRLRGENRRCKSFIGFVLNILYFRVLSYYRKKSEILFLDKEIIENIRDHSAEPYIFDHGLIRAFKKCLFSIKKKEHRDAVIIRFSVPGHIKTTELSKVLGLSTPTFSTWLYRGTNELYLNILDNPYFKHLDYEEALSCIKRYDFKVSPAYVESIDDTTLFSLWLFYKKSFSDLSQQFEITEEDVFEIVKVAMSQLVEKITDEKEYLSWLACEKVEPYTKVS